MARKPCRDPRPRRPCRRCGDVRPVKGQRWPIGPVCTPCYTTIVTTPTPCTACGEVRVLIGQTDGAAICGPCAGVDIRYTCRDCGRDGNLFQDGRCVSCVLPERTHQLITDEHGNPHPQLGRLAEAILALPNPRTAMKWVTASKSARLLATLARSGQPITHQLLDEQPPDTVLAAAHLRQALVHAGVLQPRDDYLDSIGPWLERKLAERPAHHGRLIRPYAHWHVLRPARRAAARGRTYSQRAANHKRDEIRAALRFLTWLDDHDLSLDQVTQAHLDTWLGQRELPRDGLRTFLNWTNARHLTDNLDVPIPAYTGPTEILSEPDHLDQLRRCLRDDSLPLDVRVAGALVLLFGTPLTRILALTTDRVTTTDSGTYLTIDANPVGLPPALGDLITRLAAQPQQGAMFKSENTAYLFPGRPATRPIGIDSFNVKLGRHGIRVRPSRNGALIALATELPAAVLADLLGITIVCATYWAQRAARRWDDYLAAREPSITRNRRNTAHHE